MSVYQMTADDIYEAYVPDLEPSVLLEQGRDAIANRLMAEDQLPEEAAFYAADQILLRAERLESGEEGESGLDSYGADIAEA